MTDLQITAKPDTPQIILTREFDAPRALLFRAYTEPELLKQWLGPRKYAMVVDRFEVRDGGRWRFLHTDDEGNEYGFHGVFHGTPSVDGIVQTWEWEGAPGHVQLSTVTFEERGGKTLVRTNSVYQSVEARDAEIASGMEWGVREGAQRLDELLARMKSES
jgi:uncharacterized protein YndB with AHSA1/START domain